jgi:hypothetical protein
MFEANTTRAVVWDVVDGVRQIWDVIEFDKDADWVHDKLKRELNDGRTVEFHGEQPTKKRIQKLATQ